MHRTAALTAALAATACLAAVFAAPAQAQPVHGRVYGYPGYGPYYAFGPRFSDSMRRTVAFLRRHLEG